MRFLFGFLLVISGVHLLADERTILAESETAAIMCGPELLDMEEGVKQYGQGDTIHLPQECKWEIYDQYGNIVRKGVSVAIAVRGLQAGGYYLIYEKTTMQIAVFNEEHRGKSGK